MDTIFETEYWIVNLAYEQSYLGRAQWLFLCGKDQYGKHFCSDYRLGGNGG